MRLKLLAAFVLVVLAGCQSPSTPSPSPVPTSAPTVAPSTEAPTPTPTVSGDQALVEDLVRRYFEVEDKLVENPQQLDLIATVAKGTAEENLALDATGRIERGLVIKGRLIRRGVKIEGPSHVDGVWRGSATYCSDNSDVRLFDGNGQEIPKVDGTYVVRLSLERFATGQWYVVDDSSVKQPC